MKRLAFVLPLMVFLLVGAGCVKTAETDSYAQNDSGVSITFPDQPVPEAPSQASDSSPAPTDTSSQSTSSSPLTVSTMWTTPEILPTEEIAHKYAHLQTEKGEIVIELFADTAPLTVSNFVYLTKRGYYNGLTFHRREEGFVIQGGDPRGNGTGGPGYRFADELKDSHTYTRGIVAMANAGPNTNGSQFFVMLADVPLPKAYTIFGRVVSGMEAVDAIKVGDKMTTVTVEDKS